MLRISKLTDYAILALAHMARSESGRVTARDLSEWAEVPQPTVSKILKRLAAKGILTSHRGLNGGYVLSRAPEAISLAEIIEAMEGPIALTECSEPEESERQGCARTCCPVRANWKRISDAVRQALSGVSLREMHSPAVEGGRVGIPIFKPQTEEESHASQDHQPKV